MRIARFLSSRGLTSRREAEQFIREGRVQVNGAIITDPATNVLPDQDVIYLDGDLVRNDITHTYLAFYKPVGYLSSFKKSKERGRLLGELVKSEQRLFPAGRLDQNSSGLLFLTSDGDWANRVMHPKYGKTKEYFVTVRKVPLKVALKRLQSASFEEDGKHFKAESVKTDGPGLRIVLKEGRNRQIRRLAQAANLEITSLIRIRIGSVHLGRLKEGGYRKLTPVEIASFE
ncbi:rRNA pseudouridine synthase [bacterium]|nr:rRNA pseudouridine synthase [bacterium]